MTADRAQASFETPVENRWDDPEWFAEVVTVMIRQIPRQVSQQGLLNEVIAHGFEGLFDFLYLPWDLKKDINMGYGFINFPDPRTALSFRNAFDGAYLGTPATKDKPLRVHPASTQGYQANYQHFVNTRTGQKQDPQYSPLFFPGNGDNTLSRLLHVVCPGGGGGRSKEACAAGPSFQAALAEAELLGWACPSPDAPAGQPESSQGAAQRGGPQEVKGAHLGGRPKPRGRRRAAA